MPPASYRQTENRYRPRGFVSVPSAPRPVVKNRALQIIAAIAVLVVLHFAEPVAAPIALGIFAFLLLNPLVDKLWRLGCPRALAVALIQTVIFGALVAIALATTDSLVEWFKGLPSDLRAVRSALVEVRQPLAQARESAQILSDISEMGGGEGNYKVEVAQPSWVESVIDRGPMLLATIAIGGFLSILLLVTAPSTVRALRVTRVSAGSRRRLTVCVGRAQRDVSRYLSCVVLINIGLGAATAGVLTLLGVDSPLMWGVLACVANFVPYVGAAIVLALLWISGVVQFDSVFAATWPALAFLLLTSIEGQLITPAVLGRNLAIPPPLIFIAILVFGWSWGLVGAFLAVPALVTGKAVIKYWPSEQAGRAPRMPRSVPSPSSAVERSAAAESTARPHSGAA
jgi:predicted PurR-regulated permease PerM